MSDVSNNEMMTYSEAMRRNCSRAGKASIASVNHVTKNAQRRADGRFIAYPRDAAGNVIRPTTKLKRKKGKR
jgi:hypothetical protein